MTEQMDRTEGVGDDSVAAVAMRLEWVRHYYQKSQKDFAKAIDVWPSTYSAWLCGEFGLSLNGAKRIWHAYRISLDFLFFGDPSNLPPDVLTAWKARP